jgi:hypothetical protein
MIFFQLAWARQEMNKGYKTLYPGFATYKNDLIPAVKSNYSEWFKGSTTLGKGKRLKKRVTVKCTLGNNTVPPTSWHSARPRERKKQAPFGMEQFPRLHYFVIALTPPCAGSKKAGLTTSVIHSQVYVKRFSEAFPPT